MSDTVTADFIFGTLATDTLRLEAMRAELRGLTHGHRILPPDPEPGQAVSVFVSAGTEIAAKSVAIVFTLDGSVPELMSNQIECDAGESIWDTLLWGYRCEWRGTIPAQSVGTYVRYRIAATTVRGETIWADPDPESGEAEIFSYYVDQERVPDWFRRAVIYQVFLDRFAPGTGRDWNEASRLDEIWGGTIRGTTEALPYLADLGVTCLWLSPLFPSPTHHGYDATDYFAVEPRLGTLDDLRGLFAQAHARGIRVVLDFVANHLSDQHPAFVRALTDPTAAEREWFTFSADGLTYRSFFGVTSMPQINTNHRAARDHLISAATFWLEQGADGFRLDYANGPSHDFWTAFRAATRAVKPDSVTFGEIVETAELQRSYQGRLDGTLDFLLLQQIRAFFAFESISAESFAAFLHRHLDYFPADFLLPSFLDNHDMNRFLWVADGDKRRLKLAAFCEFTLPHPPIVYYGTEVGLSQLHDLTYPDGSRRMEESRTLMPWGEEQDADLRTFYRDLIALRSRWSDLWTGKRSIVNAGDDALVLGLDASTSRGMVAINRSTTPYAVSIPENMTLAFATGPTTEVTASQFVVPPMAGALWTT
jgi:cyclomaltodextrinase / maltogenic alpha-amylase / neopullulanase